MSDPERLRDSTQIRLSQDVFDGVRGDIEAEFTVTIVEEEGAVRIIGSPVEIKAVGTFLTRQGVAID